MERHRLMLALVVGATFMLHAGALYVLQDMPIAPPSYGHQGWGEQDGHTDTQELAEQRQHHLTHVFAAPHPVIHDTPVEVAAEELKVSITQQSIDLPTPDLAVSELSTQDLLKNTSLPEESITQIYSPELLSTPTPKTSEGETAQISTLTLPTMPKVMGNVSPFARMLVDDVDNLLTRSQGEIITKTSGPSHVATSNDFSVQVNYAPARDGEGYLFEIQLIPHTGSNFKRIAHHLTFLIDRSHSIPPERFERAKHAVGEALPYLHEEDSFNIFVFDKGAIRFSQEAVKATPENIQAAHQFLHEVKHGGMFASTDLYASLDRLVPKAIDEHEVHTAILISDGDTFMDSQQQRKTVSRWTRENNGKVSLYCVGVGEGNNLPLLDLLSNNNRGMLVFSPTDSLLSSTLKTLLASIATPIGRNLTASAVTTGADTKVTLYPRNSRLPHLYSLRPYRLWGKVSDTEPFYVFLQGENYSSALDIKQVIDLSTAHPVEGGMLEQRWAVQQAFDLYDRFLDDGRTRHLAQAKLLLKPYGIPPAFPY